MEAANAGFKVVLIDSCDEESKLKKIEDTWMFNLGIFIVSLNSHIEVLPNQRRNYGFA